MNWLAIGVAATALAVALAIDRAWGEPPAWAHPVVAMGRWLGWSGRPWPHCPPALALIGGGMAWAGGAALCTGLAGWIEQALWRSLGHSLPGLLLLALLLGLLLKPMLAWRMLRCEVLAVEAALAVSLPAGRSQVARLCSRDTDTLSALQVRETAIETLAENLNDSVIAPLLWWAVAGLPGAVLYRYANTADAMWGYRGRWEWAGKVAARADDALSWVPARLTGLLLLPWPAAWPVLRRQACLTPSPNGGWAMGAMALRLGVGLGKPGVYRLVADGRDATAADTARAVQLAGQALAAAALLLAGLAGLIAGLRLGP
jgi:adenosylcobinamide-phosphate synthase